MLAEAKLPPYATHLPLLMACVARTRGPVLEMGCGAFSTPVLHAACAASGRYLLSLESDAQWLAEFRHLASDAHQLLLISDWDTAPIDHMWDVVLIDHAPALRRRVEVERLRRQALYLVVHDSEHRLYEYEPVLGQFRHRVEWRRYAPWTTVVSDRLDLEWLEPIARL